MRARPNVLQLTPYQPGKSLDELKRELGLREIVRLSANENPLGPSPRVLQAIQQFLPSIHLYPDGSCQHLRQALSAFYNLPPNHFAFGNGSDELIHFLGLAYLEPDDEVIIAHPSFVRYEAAALLNGATLHRVPLTPDYRHDLPAMQTRVNERTKLLFIANPNNPTGTLVYRDEVEQLLRTLPSHVLVVLDEAYFEYVDHPDYPDGLDYVRAGQNVVVLRTFSKAYGLAGLRIGYAVARPEILEPLERVREPFNVNSVAQVAAAAALSDQEYVRRTRELNRQGLDYFYRLCEELGLRYIPSWANFVMIDLNRDSRAVFQALLRRGVLVRTGDIFGMPTFIRVNTGTPEGNARFAEALRESLSER
ncbi:MAG: histidinol-phosphate transaminase [Armatimonadota bacterium]